MSSRSEYVPNLGRFGQWMEESRTRGGQRSTRRLARGRVSSIARLLRCALRSPGAVAQSFRPFSSIRERLRRLDCCACPSIVRPGTFEDR
jgi:hypothetical protein